VHLVADTHMVHITSSKQKHIRITQRAQKWLAIAHW